ncbi:MAG: tetratricopeptide repeat protein [Gammaproteobacteria bacterium]|nr:tetratricopeptide repeat protein [Gammaproteobacteria bacterium]MYK44711.1 tetratricopeptide repeat protein [Gammaproteobacteria bacterium]
MLALTLLPGQAQAASALAEVAKANAESDRVDLPAVDGLYDETMLEGDSIDLTIRRLGVFADNGRRSAAERANHYLTIAHIHWRHGSQERALSAVDSALDLRETPDALLLKARLLDATGNPAAATEWYRKAAQVTDRAAEREFIRIRLTMAEASDRNIDALVTLANERDQDFRNRAAITLALLGHPDQALALYDPDEEFGNPFRQQVRVAQWAIDSGDFDLAQEASWTAYQATEVQSDALYALALLAEAYRKDDALDELLVHLAEQTAANGKPQGMLVQARVDVLIETEKYDEAIAFYEAANGTRVDVAARSRLIKLYEAAGRTDDMVAEYERLMAAEPEVVAWGAGLASHYLNIARPEDALGVWHRLAASNAENVEVLVEAGESMVQMGFVEEAVAMIEDQMATAGESPLPLFFLFDLRLRRGETEAALAAVERLEATLGDDNAGVRDLADAYERLNKPEAAVRILEQLRDREGGLGYDERMRLAWLYSVADRKENALDAWRELWVRVEGAARRSLAESQFLLLATELNTLGDIVVDLEEKLFQKQANRNEIGLLVRVYTEVGDHFSATEVIEEYARYSDIDEADRLRQLGKVHMMLADYSAYDDVLRELVAVDPENEIEHVQNIVLNMLAFDLAEDSDERFGEVQHWLGELRELDEEGVSGEFEAGIYSLGGFSDEAIASYRRALVLHPENSDNLLLMADLMKTAGRRDEAVAILQYVAEHAADDAEFVVAIDGIINMIGARTFTEELTPAMRRTFRWTQRIILERIASHNDKFYLYQLLGDIAQEVGDTEAEFRAVENSLSEAGVRRPSVLRELVTLATADTGFAGFSTGSGDPERQLTHGRRLIGLRQELPPEVFINLGKVLLEEGAVQAAVQAFDLINDITGLVNVDQTKADLFDESGYPEESLNWYTRALNVSRDDLELLAKTAMLREARGQVDVANALYFRAIGNVLRTLDAKRRQERPGANASPLAQLGLGPDTSVTRDYRTYFEFLAQGFLTTWPDDPATAAERIDAVRTMFDTELSVVLGDPSWQADEADPSAKTLTIDEFTRLDRVARLARRVAARASDSSLSGHLDASLGEHFPDPTATEVADLPLLRRHMEIAKRNDDYEAAVRLARLAGDEEDLLALFRDRIDKGSYREGLAYARSLLDSSTFKRLVAAIATTLKDNTKSFLELIQADPDLVLEIESDLGRDIVTVEELFAILADPAAEAGPRIYVSSSEGVWEYLKAKASVDDQLRHLASTAARHRRGDFRSFAFSNIFHDLLSVELTAPQREALVAAASEYLAKLDLKDEFAQSTVFELLLVREAHPTNRDALYELAAEAQRLAQMAVDVAAMLPRILEGTDEEAFLALVELQRAGPRYFGGVSGRDDRYAPVRARILESAGRSQVTHDAETVRIVYELEFSNRYYGIQPPREKMERRADLLPILVERYPDDQRYLRELVEAHLDLDRWDEAEEALTACYKSDPTDEILRAALYYLLTYRDRYEAALSLVTDGGPDLREQSTVDDLLEKVQAARGFEPSSSASLFRTIYRGPLEPSYSRFSPQVDRAIDTLRDLATTEDVAPENETTQALRTVWRGASAPDPEQGFYRPDGYLVNSILSLPLTPDSSDPYYYRQTEADYRLDALLGDAGKTDSTTLFEEVASSPGSAAEFDVYLRALPDSQRRDQYRFYRLLIQAIIDSDTLDQRVEVLSGQLPELGDHDFTVWMLLRHEQANDMVESERAAFVERLAKVEDPSALQILAIARLHAKAHAYEQASQYYRLLTAKLARHGEFVDRRRVVFSDSPDGALLNLSELAREVVSALPSDLARDAAMSIVAAARRADRHDAFDAYFDAFLLRSLTYLYDPREALSEAAGLSRTATSVEVPLGEWDAPKAVELVRLHAMAGDETRAIELLRALLGTTTHGSDSGYPLTGPIQQERYELINALDTLARLYGLRRLDLYDATPAPLHELILRRERPFPADSAHHFPGDVAWMTTAANALVSWLDDAGVDRAGVLEAAFVVAWQLHSRGEDDRAKAVVAALADKITADPKRLGLDHLVLMALRVGNALPPGLAAEALAQGNLRVEQEVELIEGLRRANDAATALRVGRGADKGNKLALMRVLAALADAAGDADYVASLENRIDAAEQARRGLGLDESA